MQICVKYIIAEEDLLKAFSIRHRVFVIEQHVPEHEEYDEFERSSRHFLALADGIPCGTARWRFTQQGIKMERFAVLPEFRGKKIGSALVAAVLEDINQHPESKGKLRYLHAQVAAMPLYAKFGFQPEGEIFPECNILHYKMVLAPPQSQGEKQ
ncbi:MAG: GNAT family N-acetyltransferase [Cytophagales bacterium]|nr:GNAT family N-acetyltransferase [Bernardetiaceae bacterium]MDW8211296.1 GNAT family N-acetyltransferase [Cytophagales bacterium]